MTDYDSMKMFEDQAGNLNDIYGKCLVPAEQRTRCEVYSRVVGYLRPIAQWNRGKKAEWADRRDFETPMEEIIAEHQH